MAVNNPSYTNIISGKITLIDTGVGIPDLLVVIYDLDPNTRPEEEFGEVSPSGIRSANILGDRIGSVLTSMDGSFQLRYEDNEFRILNANEKRPDLFLMVLAPEDAGSNEVKILYKTAFRQNAGRQESYFVRLTAEQLKEAGIPIPETEKENVEDRIINYKSLLGSRIRLNKGIAEVHKEVSDSYIEEKKIFRSKLFETLAPSFPIAEGHGVLVKEDESILQKSTEVTNGGIDKANTVLGNNSSGVPVNLYLSPDDLQNLQPYFNNATDGIAEIPESEIRPILFRTSSSENIGTLLVNNNPIVKYCMEKSTEETCAMKHVGIPTPTPQPHPNGNVTSPSVTTISDQDIPTYLAKLISDMPSPDSILKPGAIKTRPSEESIEESLSKFGLKKGPAETPAYYDFHSLQIAFEHVWKQLFDEDIINNGYLLNEGLKRNSGIDVLNQNRISIGQLHDLVKTAEATPLAELPPEVAAQFEITKEEWSELSVPFRTQLNNISVQINKLLFTEVPMVYNRGDAEVRDHREGHTVWAPKRLTIENERLRQSLVEQGERIIDTVRHDDYYTMHKTLRDLHERLNSNYEYTVFAADKDHCSVNFGILNTYRQEWLPLKYQVGKLCKTIPLAPKEERKYSVKIKKHIKRTEKEGRKNNTSFTAEQTQTSRTEGEIIAKALNKTNFNLSTEGTYNIGISKGTATTSLGIEAQKESQQTRKDFREAVLKSTQEFKDERSMEITTEEVAEMEINDSGTIVNPNDELACTYLFYELQRLYRISEQLYRVMPVVLVSQPVPRPNEITESWVIAHDWILRRYLLDDSFNKALDYLANKSVGDDFALRELRRNLRQQRNLVETLKLELSMSRTEAENRYRALERAIRDRIKEEEAEETDSWFSDVAQFFGGGGQSPEAAKARELAAKEAHEFAVEKAEKMAAAVRQEVDSLHKLTADYNKTLRDHLDNETCVKRFLVHIRNNIIYYMQAIWSMEPPDQRFLRLQKVQVPHLELDDNGRTYKVQVEPSEDIFEAFRPEGTQKHKATMSGKLKKPFIYKPLIEIADLDKPMGFKGNYMIFPMKQHNALTEFMAAPYIDSAFGAMDPDELSNLNLNDFSNFICCLHKHDKDKFDELKPYLHKWLQELLADPLRNGDEIVIPSGSLYIEALPAAHPLLEDFKLYHRQLDVFKVQSEVRRMELENLRYAARLLSNEREDPEVEKQIIVSGGNGIHVES